VYVEYQDSKHELEYYDVARDPYELHNVAAQLTSAQQAELHRTLTALEACHSSTCWSAALPMTSARTR
jgi:N-acetylglucosamine-6-sulfatase